MRRIAIVLMALALISGQTPVMAIAKSPTNDEAKTRVLAAATGMGGVEKLRALKSVEVEALGHWHMLEQSERPDGPWLVVYDSIQELRDYERQRLRQTSEAHYFDEAKGVRLTMIVADGVAAIERNKQLSPFTMAQVQDAEEWLDFSPERILLNALEAQDLRTERETTLQGVPHHVVSFTWKNAPVRLFLNAHTSLPTAVELVRAHPYDTFWSVWGDVTLRTYFSLWTLEPGGIRYPRQWDHERNGQSYRTLTVTGIKFNPEIPAEAFNIPDEVRQKFAANGKRMVNDAPLGLANQQPEEIVKDFVQIRGRWNVALIKQMDGIVVLEAPISSGYSD